MFTKFKSQLTNRYFEFPQSDSGERSVAIAVRTHRTLELVDDKFYMITCGRAGFQNSRNETSLVHLRLLRPKYGEEEEEEEDDEEKRKVEHVVYGQRYTLRADISQPDGKKNYSNVHAHKLVSKIRKAFFILKIKNETGVWAVFMIFLHKYWQLEIGP